MIDLFPIKRFIVLTALMVIMAIVTGCNSSNKQEDPGQNAATAVSSSDEAGNEDLKSKTKEGETEELLTTTTSTQKPVATTTTIKAENKSDKLTKKLVEIMTNKGKIVIELYPKKAPKTVDNFIKLADSGFYDGVKWHRVEPGFVIQGGDPLSKDNDPSNDGTGGPGYMIKAEFNDMKHVTGTVAMARSQSIDSAGSQFYICLAPQSHLDGKYTVFGQVIEGMNVVNSIQVGDVMQKVLTIAK